MKAKKPKTVKAWMVFDAKGEPIKENHAWGQNYVVAKTKGEACVWNPGERAVRVEIKCTET